MTVGHARQVVIGTHTFDAILNTTASRTRLDSSATVLLLHGFPQSKSSWRPVLKHLDETHTRAIAVDQRGYSPGARPPHVADYHLDHLMTAARGKPRRRLQACAKTDSIAS